MAPGLWPLQAPDSGHCGPGFFHLGPQHSPMDSPKCGTSPTHGACLCTHKVSGQGQVPRGPTAQATHLAPPQPDPQTRHDVEASGRNWRKWVSDPIYGVTQLIPACSSQHQGLTNSPNGPERAGSAETTQPPGRAWTRPRPLPTPALRRQADGDLLRWGYMARRQGAPPSHTGLLGSHEQVGPRSCWVSSPCSWAF